MNWTIQVLIILYFDRENARIGLPVFIFKMLICTSVSHPPTKIENTTKRLKLLQTQSLEII